MTPRPPVKVSTHRAAGILDAGRHGRSLHLLVVPIVSVF